MPTRTNIPNTNSISLLEMAQQAGASTSNISLAAIGNLYSGVTYTTNGSNSLEFCEFYSNGCVGVVDNTPPSNVTNLVVGSIAQTTATLNWDTATDDYAVSGYRIYSGAGTFLYFDANPPYTFNSLSPNTPYSYKVKAIDSSGNLSTNFSNTVSFTTTNTLPSANLGNSYNTAQLAYDTATSYTTYYYDGSISLEVLDTVYSDSSGTTTFTGGMNWYKIQNTDYVVQIDSNGFVFKRYDMSQTLSITPSTNTVSSSAGSFTANVTSNTDWVVSEGLSWVSFTGASGLFNDSFTISYTANTGTQRSGTINVRTDDSAFQDSISLTQNADVATLYSHLLGYGSSSSTACSANQQTYYADSSNFATATALYTDSAGATFAGIGYYSDGESWRYWSARDNAFTADGFCSF